MSNITHNSIVYSTICFLRHTQSNNMMTSSNGNIFRVTGLCAGNSPITGEFLAQRPVTRSFHVFFDLRPNKQLNKQSWGWWFETLSGSLWRHCNESYVTVHVWRKIHLWPVDFSHKGPSNAQRVFMSWRHRALLHFHDVTLVLLLICVQHFLVFLSVLSLALGLSQTIQRYKILDDS